MYILVFKYENRFKGNSNYFYCTECTLLLMYLLEVCQIFTKYDNYKSHLILQPGPLRVRKLKHGHFNLSCTRTVFRKCNSTKTLPTRFSHCGDVNPQLKGHEAQDGEDCEARDKAGGAVQQAQGERIPATT